jgi:hypothetical protein
MPPKKKGGGGKSKKKKDDGAEPPHDASWERVSCALPCSPKRRRLAGSRPATREASAVKDACARVWHAMALRRLRFCPACWLQAVESGLWEKPVTDLPDANTWPTWGALRERVLTACREVRDSALPPTTRPLHTPTTPLTGPLLPRTDQDQQHRFLARRIRERAREAVAARARDVSQPARHALPLP